MANVNIPLPGYPTAAWGSTKVWRGDHFGPTAYNNTTGEILTAAPFFGPGGIESVSPEFGGYTFSNNYYVKAFLPNNTAPVNTEQYASAFGVSNANANANNMPQLVWYIASNNAQVAANTNLAAEVVRLSVTGV